MQFGVFTVGDVTTDPTTGRTPTEAERIKVMVTIALKAEEVGWMSSRRASTTTRRSSRPLPPPCSVTSRPVRSG
jgi:hypothetical protein